MIHESSVRFEHCYRLDMDPEIASSHRLHCWRDWTQTYAEGGQSQDRVEYARRRIIALESGDTRLVTIHTAPRPQARLFSLAGEPANADGRALAPAPTSANAPPPALAPREKGVGTEPQADPLPQGTCAQDCETTYRSCANGCVEKGPCDRCSEDYAVCMRRCFN
jgi:hypothetical protein